MNLTPEEEAALVAATAAAIEAAAREAQQELVALIAEGMAPRDAVRTVAEPFQGEMAAAMAAALSRILGESIGEAAVLAIQVGTVRLSTRLYAEAVAAEVQQIVQEHARGMQDARALALQMFEGYAFRRPDEEPLRFNPREPRLPRYLRDLVRDGEMATEFDRAFARMQVDGLTTQALRAAYSQLLDALDGIAAGKGTEVLQRRLDVAFFERMRYFATRIARTELHRAYAEREARLIMEDTDVEFVQIRRGSGSRVPCICALMAGRDRFGLGPGVYPKAVAPLPPYHPFCQCVVSPRLDLTGRPTPEERDGADVSFLERIGQPLAARVMGSQARRDRVLRGDSADAVANSTRDPAHRIRTVGEVSATLVPAL